MPNSHSCCSSPIRLFRSHRHLLTLRHSNCNVGVRVNFRRRQGSIDIGGNASVIMYRLNEKRNLTLSYFTLHTHTRAHHSLIPLPLCSFTFSSRNRDTSFCAPSSAPSDRLRCNRKRCSTKHIGDYRPCHTSRTVGHLEGWL